MDAARHAAAAAFTATVLLALAGQLAGCGSSSGKADSADRARYAASANTICAAAQRQTVPLIDRVSAAGPSLLSGAAGSAHRLAPAVAQLHVVAAASLTKLRAIPQPRADHAAIEAFLTPLGNVVGAIGQAAAALAQGQSARALALIQQAQPDAQQVTSAAQALGMRPCGSVVAVLG